MTCETVLGAVAAGEPLSEAEQAHLDGCARCRAAGRLTGLRPVVTVAAPPVPTRGALVARERRRTTGIVVLVAAVVLGSVGGAALLGETKETRPPVALGAGLMDTLDDAPDELPDGVHLARLVPRDPLATPQLTAPLAPEPLAGLDDPTDLFEAALLGERSP